MKHTISIILLFLANVTTQGQDLTRYIKGDYNAKADSMELCLINNFMDKTRGTFYSTPRNIENSSKYIYWQQAHAIDVVVYAYERLRESDPNKAVIYKNYIRKWATNYANNYHGRTFENPYTDDMIWIGLTLTHMAEALEMDTYYAEAKKLWDRSIITRAIRDSRGLRLPWNWDNNPDGTWKDQTGNACTNGPATLLAARLYLKYGQESYLQDAKDLCAYMVKNICKTDGRVEEPPLTYTQGAFGEACRVLYHITGGVQYRTRAYDYINYAFTSGRCTHNGLLRHEGESMDQSIFKAVLIPYACNFVLDEKMPSTQRRAVMQKMQTNAEALWRNLDHSRYPQMYCSYYWGERYDYNSGRYASMGAMTSGASLIENVARMHNALLGTGTEDAIRGISAAPTYHSSAYTPSGLPAQTSKHGLVIKNGKKYINK